MSYEVMDGLMIKDVDFNGTTLKAAMLPDGKIYVGIKYICNGIGLSEGKIKRERKKLMEDMVLSKGGLNLILPTEGGNQPVLCLDIHYVPIWLAKVSITPNMIRENPDVVRRLVEYQFRAKDVLAEAFLGNSALSLPLTRGVQDYAKKIVAMEKTIDALRMSVDSLAGLMIAQKMPVKKKKGRPKKEKETCVEIVKPLAEKRGDTSYHYMKTLKSVYRNMGGKNTRAYKMAETHYFKQTGRRPQSRVKLVESSPALMRDFKRAVGEMELSG